MAKAKPKFNKVDILAILDRSGSMGGMWIEEIGGFNAFIEGQKKEPGEAALTLVHFDNEFAVHFDRLPIDKFVPLTGLEFAPRGGTALLDALGRAITEHDARIEKSDHTIVVVTTDGQENASQEWSAEKIKALVTEKEKSGKYTFIFLAANIDAFAAGGSMGFAASGTTSYNATAAGTSAKYAAVTASASSVRSLGAMNMTMSEAYAKAMANTDPQAA
jgi:uncharacterized protein YegL